MEAGAAVITSLAGAQQHAFPEFNEFNGGSGPHVRVFDGGSFTSDEAVLWGWTSSYDFHEAGSPAAISYTTGVGRFAFEFSSPVGAALLRLDWGQQNPLWAPLSLNAYDSEGSLLESLVLASGGMDRVDRGNIGFSFADAGIRRLELSGHYFSARDLVSGGAVAAVPEPATWAMMIAGFGMVGGAMRFARGRRKVAVSYG
jgi:hypothetical protein